MFNKLLNTLGTVGIGAAIIVGAITSGIILQDKLQPTPPEVSVGKFDTYQDIQDFIDVISYEAEMAGGSMTIKNVNGKILTKLKDKIAKRPVVERTVEINGRVLNKNQYQALRDEMVNKIIVKNYDDASIDSGN